MINKVKDMLQDKISIKQKDFSSSLIPNALPMLGVRIPDLRIIGKYICNNDYYEFLKEEVDSFEKQWLMGYVIACSNITLDERFMYLDKFIPTIKDWAVLDGLVSNLKCSKKFKYEFFNYIIKYKDSKMEFEVRFISVMLMTYYLNDEYIDKVYEIIDDLYLKDYYAKMGVAWCLSTALAKYPDKTIKYLESNKLDRWTIKKTISKARESYRITKEVKDYILRFKS